jgi:hypothetical protein
LNTAENTARSEQETGDGSGTDRMATEDITEQEQEHDTTQESINTQVTDEH